MTLRDPILVATVGLAGTGKSEVTRHLADRWGFVPIYFGGVVIEETRRRGLPPEPQHERVVREELREAEGMDVMARRSIPSISKALEADRDVAIDGLYSMAEQDLLRSLYGNRLVVLAVHASRHIRYRRLRERPTRPLSKDEVDARDFAEIRK